MLLSKFISIYPGPVNVGVACWVFVNGRLYEAAVGSVEARMLPVVVERFNPQEVLMEPYRVTKRTPKPVKLPDGVSVTRVFPAWVDETRGMNYPWVVRRLPVEARKAFALGYYELFQRRNHATGSWRFIEFTYSWLSNWKERQYAQ